MSIHVTGVACEPGGAHSSGTPGLTSIMEVHVEPRFAMVYILVIIFYVDIYMFFMFFIFFSDYGFWI